MTALVICLCGARAKEISSKKKKDDHGKFMNVLVPGLIARINRQGRGAEGAAGVTLIQSSGAVYIMDYWTWTVSG